MKRIMNFFSILNSNENIIKIVGTEDEKVVSPMVLKDKGQYILYNLNKMGLKKKDTLIIQYEDNRLFDLICVFWGCALGGIIPIFLSDLSSNKSKIINVNNIISNSKVLYVNDAISDIDEDKQIALDEILKEEKQGEIVEIEEDDTMFMQFSSGTTGTPKGVIITYKNIITSLEDMKIGADLSKSETFESWMPLSHDMGLIGFHILPMYLGIKQVLISTTKFIKNPLLLLELAEKDKCTSVSATNFTLKIIMKLIERKSSEWKCDLSSIKKLFIGAEPIDSEIVEEFTKKMEKFNFDKNAIIPVYGLAEATLGVAFSEVYTGFKYLSLNKRKLFLGDKIEMTSDISKAKKVINLGKPLPSFSVQIVDENNEEVPDGTIGYIKIKGDSVIDKYYNNVKAECFKDNWFNTFDLGFIYNEEIYVLGRNSDIIYVNGNKYFSQEIEELCEKYLECTGKIAICGVHDKSKGYEEIVCFYEEVQDLLTYEKINSIVETIRNNNIYINKIVGVKEIYKTPSGKLMRYKLVEEYKNQLEESRKKELGKDIKKCFEEILEKDIQEDDDFFNSGGSSINAILLSEVIKEKVNMKITVDEIYKNSTVNKLTNYLINR